MSAQAGEPIDAGLGRKDDAMVDGKRACELLPLSKDPSEGPVSVTNLALIYVWVGEKDPALEELSRSIKGRVGISYGELKLGPAWDPLRRDARFQELLNAAATKVKKTAP